MESSRSNLYVVFVANYLWRDESWPPLLSIQSLFGDLKLDAPRTRSADSAPPSRLITMTDLVARTCASATRRRDRREWPPSCVCCGRLRRPRKIMRAHRPPGVAGRVPRGRGARSAGRGRRRAVRPVLGPSGLQWSEREGEAVCSPTRPRRWPAWIDDLIAGSGGLALVLAFPAPVGAVRRQAGPKYGFGTRAGCRRRSGYWSRVRRALAPWPWKPWTALRPP